MIKEAEVAENHQKRQFFSRKATTNKYKCNIALRWKILSQATRQTNELNIISQYFSSYFFNSFHNQY